MKLFEPAKIGTMDLKNHIISPAMNERFGSNGGYVTEGVLKHYARRAEGGAALIIIADGGVDTFHVNSFTQLRVSDDSYIQGLAKLAQAIQEKGAKAALQLQHAGLRTSRVWGLEQALGATTLTGHDLGENYRAMSLIEIKLLIRQFAQAARRAKEAGFDAIEIHAGHGYLLTQFLSPYTNWRQDEYGGNNRNRARLVLEIISAIRKEVGNDYPIIIRISADDLVEGGNTLRETRVISHWLEEAGVDCISVSGGHDGSKAEACMLVPRGHMIPLATAIKSEVSVPVIAVGRINTPAMAETILQEGKADLIALGRPLLADPDWPRKVMEGKENEIRRCLYCMCCSRDPGPGYPIMCIVNPEIGREYQTESLSSHPKKILVIGGGPAGLEAARVAQLRGHNVTIWEEKPKLGGHWSWLIDGYITEALKVLAKLGVKIELSKCITAQSVADQCADIVLVAPRGTRPDLTIAVAQGEKVFWADEVLDRKVKLLGKVVVIGDGNIGCEVAYSLCRHDDVELIIIGNSEKLGYGTVPGTEIALVDKLKKCGVQFRSGYSVRAIQDQRVLYQDKDGYNFATEADAFVLAIPSQPTTKLIEQLQNAGLEFYMLPYCDKPSFVSRAIRIGASIGRQI